MTGCDTTVNNGADPFDPTGTVTGRLVDRVSNAPLSGAVVTLSSARDEEGEAVLVDSTGADGVFRFDGVPVNQASGAAAASGRHVLDVNLAGVDGPYRARYRAEVELSYGESGDGASGNNLTASVTLPISPLNASVSGIVSDVDGDPLSNVSVALVQRLPLGFDATGSPSSFTDVEVASVSTGDDGGFSFDAVESTTDAFLVLRVGDDEIGRDPSSDYFRIPATTGETVQVDRGPVVASPPAFAAQLVSPQRGVDLDATSVEMRFAFNAPVKETPFADPTRPFGDGAMRDFIRIESVGPKLRSTGDLELNLSFNDDRTELTISPAEALQDGFRYTLEIPAFADSRFESVFGQSVSNANAFSGSNGVSFSVGVNQNAPATPSIQYATESGDQPLDNPGDPYDYFDNLSATYQIPVDESEVAVKEYEIFVKSGDADFQPVEEVGREDFEFSESGRVEFSISFEDRGDEPLNNFIGDNGEYNEKQVRVRAVSINNQRSDFSNTLTLADENPINVLFTDVEDVDDDGEDELVVSFGEPVRGSTLALGGFTVLRDGSELTGVLESVRLAPFDAQEIIVELSDGYTPNADFADDELRVETGGVTDLAGNEIDADGDANVVNI